MAYVEYEADGKTIKARVQQKTDTLANWMANPIPLKDGEQAFVITGEGQPLQIRLGWGGKRFSELPNWIDFNNAQRVAAQDPGVLVDDPSEETRYMEVTAIGTYTYGGNTLAEITEDGYKATFWWTGTEWISNGVVRAKGDDGKTIEVFKADKVGGYTAGSQIIEGSNIYEVKTGQTLTIGQKPSENPTKVDIIFKGEDGTINELLGVKNLPGDGNFGTFNNAASLSTPFIGDIVFTYENIELIKGAKITGINIKVVQDGTLTIFTVRNIKGDDIVKTIATVLNVNASTNYYPLDIQLQNDEVIAVGNSTDTCGGFYFISGSFSPQFGGVISRSVTTNELNSYPNNLNIVFHFQGIPLKRSDVLDEIEKNIYEINDKNDLISDVLDLNINPNGLEQIIPYNNLAYSESSSIDSSRFTYRNLTVLSGKFIKELIINVAQGGTFSVYKGVNINQPSYNEVLLTTLNLEVGVKNYPINVQLDNDETLLFTSGTDTAKFNYYPTAPNPVGGGFYQRNNVTGAFTIADGADLSIGVAIQGEPAFSQKLRDIDKKISALNGKRIGFVGDSISTYVGEIVSGNDSYYPIFGVDDVKKTWWHQLAEFSGADIIINDSWSGSLVSNFGSGSLQTRLNRIPRSCDYLFILMGINDQGGNIPLGTLPDVNDVFNVNEFTGAYCNALREYSTKNTNTKIVVLTPLRRYVAGTESLYINSLGLSSDDYGDRIVEICNLFGIECINTRGLGWTAFNHSTYLGDGLHPNSKGMDALFQFIARRF